MTSFLPLQACLGGAFIGVAAGVYMLGAARIAGNSGALKAIVLGPREATKVTFVVGLLGGGALMSVLLPTAFERPPTPTLSLVLAGLAVGFGTALSNGCTSGHGLCGLSRYSLRSLAAVPAFLGSAVVAATLVAQVPPAPLSLAPMGATPSATLTLMAELAAGLGAALPLCFLVPKSLRQALVGLWVGACFAVGLSVGGMIRPSVVTGALSLFQPIDLTLWVLFVSALVVTFAFYRLASIGFSMREACALGPAPQPRPDSKLLCGSVLFGLGWGVSGYCPGPFLVALASSPVAPGPLLFLAAVVGGMRLTTSSFVKGLFAPVASTRLATPAELKAALANPSALVVDIRPIDPKEMTQGTYEAVIGSLSAPWDGVALPLGALPVDKSTPLILHCRTGNRVRAAAAFLRDRGYSFLLNAGGPAGDAELWQCFGNDRHVHNLTGFKQLFDGPAPGGGGSSTYTYLLWDDRSKEALIIDPVLEQVERDLAEVSALGVRLVAAVNTHCHADHITGTGALKKRVPGLVSLISKAAGAKADRTLDAGETIKWAQGKRTLKVLPTPGHTSGCVSLVDETLGAVFTGDALLIGGCGRTDFQEGDAATLHHSVHSQLFTLPDGMLVLPAHDYKGRQGSTIGTEKRTNSRLTKSVEEFAVLMSNLALPYPKKIDAALPANLRCGLDL